MILYCKRNGKEMPIEFAYPQAARNGPAFGKKGQLRSELPSSASRQLSF